MMSEVSKVGFSIMGIDPHCIDGSQYTARCYGVMEFYGGKFVWVSGGEE